VSFNAEMKVYFRALNKKSMPREVSQRYFLTELFFQYLQYLSIQGKNGSVPATKLGTTNEFLVASTKNFAAATKRFVDRTKHFVVTKYFCYPYFNK